MHKGRFPSLTNLRLGVVTKKDIDLVSDHIMTCAVLHNILTKLDKDDTKLMDPHSRKMLENIQREQAARIQARRGVDYHERVDFNDWKSVARYDAAMRF